MRWEWHVPLLIPAVVGVVAVPVTGGAGQGPNHDYATSTVIVFAIAVSVWAGLRMVAAVAPPDAVVRGRVRVAGLGAAAVALPYGIALVVLRVGLDNLTTAYGWLAITGGAALVAGLISDVAAARARARTPGPSAPLSRRWQPSRRCR